jgi:serine/threonine protein kinase
MAPEIFNQNAEYSYPCDGMFSWVGIYFFSYSSHSTITLVWSYGMVMLEVIAAGRNESPSFYSPKVIEKISKTGQLPFSIGMSHF